MTGACKGRIQCPECDAFGKEKICKSANHFRKHAETHADDRMITYRAWFEFWKVRFFELNSQYELFLATANPKDFTLEHFCKKCDKPLIVLGEGRFWCNECHEKVEVI